jgi:hypothetical protein
MGGYEEDPRACPLEGERAIEVHGLVLRLDGDGGGLLLSPFCHEVGEDLGLNCGAGGRR